MKLLLLFIFNSIFTFVNCFTNGTLLPSYLCGQQNDGYPKSVGTLIPFLRLGEVNTTYNFFPPGGGNIPIQTVINTYNKNVALAPSAKQIIGAFHNGQAATNYTTPLNNPIVIVPTDFTNFTTGIVNPNFKILPDTFYNMSLVVNLPIFNHPAIALDGAFVYAFDDISQLRVGVFTSGGNNMQNWYACSLNNKYPINTGIVHNSLLSETARYDGIVWQSPVNLTGNITFIGAGVTDYGYGKFAITYKI
jgi:hypothetical protein